MKFWDPAPILLPPIRAGEIDGRFIDLTADLGSAGDVIPSIGVVSVVFTRRDGFPVTSNDLGSAGSGWPDTLDATGLILTLGLLAPSTAAGVSYGISVTVNKTMQGRLFIRDMTIDVLASMG